jgi:microcystin-dependent protein
MWAGAVIDVPTGWVLCDGTNGTPDLRGRFVVGAGDTYAVDATGGAESITDVPAHTHGVGTLATASDGAHEHQVGVRGSGSLSGGTDNSRLSRGFNDQTALADATGYVRSAGAHTHSITGSTASTGTSSVDIRPPYYALCYIMKV